MPTDPAATARIDEELAAIADEPSLAALEERYLGRQGLFAAELAATRHLPEDRKKERKAAIKDREREAAAAIAAKRLALDLASRDEALKGEAEALAHVPPKVGHLHPLTVTVRKMNAYFERLGYSVVAGPEIETEEFGFRRLNVPEDHPARDMQDTVYIEHPDRFLRTQTSSTEAHVLAEHKPPFKVVIPGRAYRNEKPNKTNHFVFHQYQGVVVLRDTSMRELFGAIRGLFEELYGKDVVIRFRNKYYPEVEPGVGPDMRCFNCAGAGCAVCKHVGWIEMGGAGMIHPAVMRAAGLDPKEWRGFAFGLGLDRWVMAHYRITDIRTLLGGHLAYKHHEHARAI